MSTLKTTNIQHASAASAAITLDANGQATLNGLAYPTSGSLSGRNRIINGDMRIDQRNAGASVTLGSGTVYTLDRFAVQSGVASKLSAQQNAGSTTPPAGFNNYLGLTSLSAYTVGAGEIFALRHYVEGFNVNDLNFGTANAKTITLSFWVRSSLTGTFGGSLNNNSNRSYPFTYSVSTANTWEQKTVTIAGDTSGTWQTGNATGLLIEFGLGVGSTYSGTAGAWTGSYVSSVTGATSVVATNGATFYITGVQLEAGGVATPFERRSYGQELSLCQRYFCKTFNTDVAPAQNVGAVGALVFISQAVQPWDAMWRFPVQMRTAPTTVTTYSTNQASANWSLNTDSPTASVLLAGDGGLAVRASTPAAAGRSYTIHASASAEL